MLTGADASQVRILSDELIRGEDKKEDAVEELEEVKKQIIEDLDEDIAVQDTSIEVLEMFEEAKAGDDDSDVEST